MDSKEVLPEIDDIHIVAGGGVDDVASLYSFRVINLLCALGCGFIFREHCSMMFTFAFS